MALRTVVLKLKGNWSQECNFTTTLGWPVVAILEKTKKSES